MINDKQIRAARALLNWTQETLSEMSGIARATIKNVENGDTLPRLETMRALQRALEVAGIEFMPGSGVRVKDRIVETYDGEGANRRLVEDIYYTLRDSGGELLIAHLDEGNAIKNLGNDFIQDQIKKRRASKITHRLLVRMNDPYVIPPLDTYHCLPDQYFSPYPLYIYGSKLALVSWEPAPRVVVVEDDRFSESARKLFNFVWDRTEKPSPKRGRSSS